MARPESEANMAESDKIRYENVKELFKLLQINPYEFWLECESAIGYWPDLPDRLWPRVDVSQLAHALEVKDV
jgi:hypothetical protein